jgi:hypothetical protein
MIKLIKGQRLTAPIHAHHGAPAMQQPEFEQVYRAEMARTGTGITDADVCASWRTYEKNPAGHWAHGATR